MSVNSLRARNQIATKPSQRFGTATVECPPGGDIRKYTLAKECATKNQKMTVHHFGFTEKVYRLPFSTTPRQHNTSFAEGGLPLLVCNSCNMATRALADLSPEVDKSAKLHATIVVNPCYPPNTIRHDGSDVYLGMSQIPNGGYYLMYYHASVTLAKQSQTLTIKGHKQAFSRC